MDRSQAMESRVRSMPITRPFGVLKDPGGLTLIEVIVLMAVMVVLFLSIYIGVVYAEKTLVNNYRDRVATLLISGELEMEYYRHSRSRPFLLQQGTEFVIDELARGKQLKGRMYVNLTRGAESSNERMLNYVAITGTLVWRDPSSKKDRYIRMREDYFI